eukprot:TRINITY_DN32512_c0_g1_i1.p1 TRINITY_DN32512_c0_g1~~TRINITY_DN32512_c0_g1_i1.p1  ORF type:complete len:378 (-),score=61.82 TRINITY_DN32512_c0_g1_i1:190-1293(-)
MAMSAVNFRSGEPKAVTIVRVIREVTETRWRMLETMILEERANRIKDVAELRHALAMLSEEASGAQALSNDCKYMPQISLETATTEMVGRSGTQTDASSMDLQAYSDLITEQRQHFSSQLQELESMLLSETQRAELLDGTMSTMKQLSDIIQDTSAADGTLPGPEEGIPATTLVSLEAVLTGMTSAGPLPEKQTGATALFKCDASTGLEPMTGEGAAVTSEVLKSEKEGLATTDLILESKKDENQGIVNACSAMKHARSSDTFKPSSNRTPGETAQSAKATPRSLVIPRLASSTGVLRSPSLQDTSKTSPFSTLNTSRHPYPGRAVAPSCKRKSQKPQSNIIRPALQCQDRSRRKQSPSLQSARSDR